MPIRHTRRVGALRGASLVLAFGGCGSDDQACVFGATLWDDAPAGLVCIRGDLVIEGRGPDDLGVLAHVEEIEGSLFIHENPALFELPAWPALVRIGGSLSISNNAALAAVRGFPALEEFTGEVYVAENPNLIDFILSDRVIVVDSLFFGLNAQLAKIGGMEALARVERDVRVVDNAGLTTFDLPALVEIEGDFLLAGNSLLRVPEFPALHTVGEQWTISGNDSLESLAGFSALGRVDDASITANNVLEEIEWTGPFEARVLTISRNERLQRVSASAAVRFEGGARVIISHNPLLNDIEGFGGVMSLANLTLEHNNGLRAISGLTALAQIGSELRILHNPALMGPVDLFPALVEASNVWIFDNTSLPVATVDALMAHVAVGGTSKIGDNEGQETALDPCPWPEDYVCDAEWGWYGAGTGLCAADPEDCEEAP